MPSDRDQLIREYREYDAKVDIVSSFEVFFCRSTNLPATVEHFERFPRYTAPDGFSAVSGPTCSSSCGTHAASISRTP